MSFTESMKKFGFRYTNWFKPRYPYNTEPIQLATLIYEIERLRLTPGAIVEIGVARGLTTRFLCEHIKNSGLVDTPYYAIDTFQSFVKRDLDFEFQYRNKKRSDLKGHFGYNEFDVWQRNFREFPFINAIQADCATFDFSSIAPFKLAFLDVDLYLPTQKALPIIYDLLSLGGTILVDDVKNHGMYDGAYQAYMEFCEQQNFNPLVVGNKCGIIRKPVYQEQLSGLMRLNAGKDSAFDICSVFVGKPQVQNGPACSTMHSC